MSETNERVLCEEHARYMEHLNGFITLASARAGKDLYTNPPFRFCPWCGQEARRPDSDGLPHHEEVLGILKKYDQ